MEQPQWDVVVIGGGPAGLSAALMLGRARRRVLVIDAGSPRNRFASHMHGVLGNDGTEPAVLLERGRAELAKYAVQVQAGSVERVDEIDGIVRVAVAGTEEILARALIVATGLSDELPTIPGLVERWGRSVLHCPYCHGWEVRGQRLGVLITSPLGLHQAELVRQWSDRVTVFTAALGEMDPAARRRLAARGLQLVDAPVTEVVGNGDRVTEVRLSDGRAIALDAIFTAGTLHPHDQFLAHLGLRREHGPAGDVLAVDGMGKTSGHRIWAAGNVVDPGANVPIAMSAGTKAGAAVNAALVAEEFDIAFAGGRERDETAPAEYWEDRYAGSVGVWSGRPNQAVVDVVSDLTPGRALDLGCGEGADAIWLALQGWTVTGVDIAPSAVERATRAAVDAGVPGERIHFEVADLGGESHEATYDLVTASFLHSLVELPRMDILRRAAAQVSPGGHLLIVSHVAPPPGDPSSDAHRHHGAHLFLDPRDEIETLGLGDDDWVTVIAERRSRQGTAPDGGAGTLEDGIVLLRRA